MSKHTPEQLAYIESGLSTAIELGSSDGVNQVLRQLGAPPAAMLGKMMHHVLEAPPYQQVADFNNTGSSVNRHLIPKSEALYEANLKRIVMQLAENGADMSVPGDKGQTAAQRCFDNSADDRLPRWSACLEIVKATLRQKPDWQPDVTLPFRLLPNVPEDKGVHEHRRDISRFNNTLGNAVTNWLGSNSPNAASLALQIPLASRNFWKNKEWQTDPDVMPWMNMDALRLGRETSAVFDKAFQQALTDSGLRFAFGAPSGGPNIQGIIKKAKGNPPKAE